MQVLQVGQPYDPARRSWPETEQIRLDRTTALLVRFWPQPSPGEVRAHETGTAKFALVDQSPDLLLLAYQYGDLDWSDSPFQAHRMTTTATGWPAGGPTDGILFRTLLVDSTSGILMALRYHQWSGEFSNSVRVAVAEQLIHSFDDEAAGAKLRTLYNEYESPEQMARNRAAAFCESDGPVLGGNQHVAVHHY